VKFIFWHKYAYVLARYYILPLVQHAIMFGFKPVFVVRNVRFSPNNYRDETGFRLCTVDIGAKTLMGLAGFYRTNRVSGDTQFFVLGKDGMFPMLMNIE
jgi:hypothetical protein